MCETQHICAGVSKWIKSLWGWDFSSSVQTQSEIFRENIKNGDEPLRTTEFLFLFVQSWRVEERFVVLCHSAQQLFTTSCAA